MLICCWSDKHKHIARPSCQKRFLHHSRIRILNGPISCCILNLSCTFTPIQVQMIYGHIDCPFRSTYPVIVGTRSAHMGTSRASFCQSHRKDQRVPRKNNVCLLCKYQTICQSSYNHNNIWLLSRGHVGFNYGAHIFLIDEVSVETIDGIRTYL